jgi:hypothetical protein
MVMCISQRICRMGSTRGIHCRGDESVLSERNEKGSRISGAHEWVVVEST